jgi:hypothetical protein
MYRSSGRHRGVNYSPTQSGTICRELDCGSKKLTNPEWLIDPHYGRITGNTEVSILMASDQTGPIVRNDLAHLASRVPLFAML